MLQWWNLRSAQVKPAQSAGSTLKTPAQSSPRRGLDTP